MSHAEQRAQIATGEGFIAALDQSGGSTPKALRLYGIGDEQYSTEAEMFELVHAMRARIVQAPAFSGDKIIGAILFEKTMDREIAGKPSARYLWEERGIVPFLKVDKGLAEPANGTRRMKPMPDLDALLERGVAAGVFGTKMRSVIDAADPTGIAENVDQQFEVAERIRAHGLVPIIEPEITINIPDKTTAEALLRDTLRARLDALPEGAEVVLKLTLPETPDLYAELVDHPRTLRVVALSGGYSREESNERLAQNRGMIASFSRALTEGLSVDQSETDFNATLARSIDGIRAASMAGRETVG